MDFSELMKMLGDPSKLRARTEEMRQKLASITATGSAGGGMVKITMNGSLELVSIEIVKEVVDPADIVMLQDLIKAAHADAVSKIKESMGSQFADGLTGFPGIGL